MGHDESAGLPGTRTGAGARDSQSTSHAAKTALILESISDACVFLDREWRYVYVNERAARIFDRRPQDLVGKKIWEEFPEGVGQPFHLAYERAMASQMPEQIESYYPPYDRWFENRIYPSHEGLAIFFQDVTERHKSERARRQLARAVEATTDFVAIADQDGSLRFLNGAARAVLGLAPDAPVESLVLTALVPSEAAEILMHSALPTAVRAGSWRGELTVRAHTGRTFPTLGVVTYAPGGPGEDPFFAIIARDITEQKFNEAQAHEEAEICAQAERMAHLGRWEWSVAENKVTWSDELFRIYGLAPSEFGASFEAYLARVHHEDRVRVRAIVEATVREGRRMTFDERIVRPNGEVRYLHSWASPRSSEQGIILGLVGACLDTTELTHATSEMQRHRDWLRMALDASRIGLWEWDRATGRVEWSEGVEDLFGVERGSFQGTYTAFLGLVHPDDREAVEAAIESSLATGADYQVLHRVVQRDGSLRWIEGRGRVMRNDAGEPIRMAGSVGDVTARRVLEDQLRQSQKMDAIGRLAAGVAHDFNNLLTVILAMADIAGSDDAIGETARGGLEEITAAAQRASTLTRQLLLVARKQAVSEEMLDVNAIVDSTASMLRRLLAETIVFETNLAPELPPVLADRGQLEQVVLNLALNARDAMPNGGRLTIATTAESVAATSQTRHPLRPGRYVAISCRDTGTGMSRETRAHLFEPFFTTKAAGKGTGLGLSMVYSIVRDHGGMIEVDSEEGRGSCFTAYFPAQERTVQLPARPQPMPGRPANGEVILLVDDEDAVRRTLRRVLESLGYKVVDASGATEALRVFRETRPPVDLLLTDVGMPDMNGMELATALRSDSPGLAVVLMTGHTDKLLQPESLGAAAISKPFTQSQLAVVLRDAFSRRAATKPAS